MLTRRELAAPALAAAAAPLAGCGGFPKSEDALVWQDVGPLEGHDEVGPYVLFARRQGDDVVAMSRACTHLGCPVRFVEASRRFICPCHGAVFDERGRGRPRVVDGHLQVARRPSSASGEKS